MTWTLQCDTTGDGTFDESVTNILPIINQIRMQDSFDVGHFKGKKTDYLTGGSVDVIFRNHVSNKSLSFTSFTDYDSIQKMFEWYFQACREYSYSDPKAVVRLLDDDGNILTMNDHRFAFCLITGLNWSIAAGDPTRTVMNIALKTVGYQ